MKKKVLCLFALILYFLTTGFLLAQKIEKEMATQVLISVRTTAASSAPTSQPMRVLFTDGEGDHLYEVVDGTGWENGLRIHEMQEGIWRIVYDRFGPNVQINGGSDYRFVESASRQPPDGKLAEIVEEFEIVEDQYLVIYSGNVPEEPEWPENSEVSAQRGNVLLLEMKQAERPFFEHRAKTLSDAMEKADRVFSLREVKQFLEEIPEVMTVALVMAMGVIIWAYSCFLSIRGDENRWLIWINAAIVVLLVLFLSHMLGTIDLPASLLPSLNIYDLQHYREEFALIFGALEDFENQNILALWSQMREHSMAVLRNGILVMAVVLAAEEAARRLRRRLAERRLS